ncbi:MAG: hypothetical protein ACI8WT_005145 [Clostridium sp.]|jgi:hypothetical protein
MQKRNQQVCIVNQKAIQKMEHTVSIDDATWRLHYLTL